MRKTINIELILFFIWILVALIQNIFDKLLTNPLILYVDELFGFGLLIFIIFRKGTKSSFHYKGTVTPFFFLLAFLVIQEMIKSSDMIRSSMYIFYTVKFYIVYFISINTSITTKEFEWFLRKLEYLFIFIGVVGIVDLITSGFITELLGHTIIIRGGIRLQSIFMHPSIMGWFCSVFSGYYFLRLIFRTRIWWNLIGFLFSFCLLILTDSRKSLLGLFIGIFFCWIFFYQSHRINPFKNRVILFSISIFVIVFLLSLPFIVKKIAYTTSEYSLSDASAPRILLYQVGYEIMKDNFPFGSGVGTYGSIGSLRPYSDVYYEYGLWNIHGFSPDVPNYINDAYWASVIAEIGIIGTILILILLFLIFLRLRSSSKYKDDSGSLFYLMFSTFLLIELLFESLSAPSLSLLIITTITFGIIGFSERIHIPININNKIN